MRLISHNMLKCNVKSCTENNYPLKINYEKTKIVDTEFNKEFLENLITKLNWEGLAITVRSLNKDKEFPEKFSEELLQDEKFLYELHNILLQTHIIEGSIECPNCKRKYPIKNGIPNMILTDEEMN